MVKSIGYCCTTTRTTSAGAADTTTANVCVMYACIMYVCMYVHMYVCMCTCAYIDVLRPILPLLCCVFTSGVFCFWLIVFMCVRVNVFILLKKKMFCVEHKIYQIVKLAIIEHHTIQFLMDPRGLKSHLFY